MSLQSPKSMSVLFPMTPEAYADYLDVAVPAYAADKVASGQWAAADAMELSRKSYAELLPRGVDTPDHYLFTIGDSAGLPVGMIWMALQDRADRRVGFIYDVSVEVPYRRQGYATAAFRALEDRAGEFGISGIALHVFGHNPGAQALYTKLGYSITNVNMFKAL